MRPRRPTTSSSAAPSWVATGPDARRSRSRTPEQAARADLDQALGQRRARLPRAAGGADRRRRRSDGGRPRRLLHRGPAAPRRPARARRARQRLIRCRHPRAAATGPLRPSRRDGDVLQRAPRARASRGGRVPARPLLLGWRGLDVSGRGLDGDVRSARRRRGRRARRAPAGRQPAARARARLLLRRGPPAVGPRRGRRRRRDRLVRATAAAASARRCGSPVGGSRAWPRCSGPTAGPICRSS